MDSWCQRVARFTTPVATGPGTCTKIKLSIWYSQRPQCSGSNSHSLTCIWRLSGTLGSNEVVYCGSGWRPWGKRRPSSRSCIRRRNQQTSIAGNITANIPNKRSSKCKDTTGKHFKLQVEPRYNVIYGTQRYLRYSEVYVIVNMGMSHGNMYLKMIVSTS